MRQPEKKDTLHSITLLENGQLIEEQQKKKAEP